MDATHQMLTESMPVGFRFYPTDEEIIKYYLQHKMNGHESLVSIIREVDICKYEPWQLPDMSVIKSNDPEWFFFCPYDFKYSNSDRKNRKTTAGFWKPTGEIRKIKSRGSHELIGTKKTLVFYKGRFGKCESTCWVMHEYHATASHKNVFYLCRLMKKSGDKCSDDCECANKIASSSEDQSPCTVDLEWEADDDSPTGQALESQICNFYSSFSSCMHTMQESLPTLGFSWGAECHWLEDRLVDSEEQKEMDDFFETVLTDQSPR